MLPSIFHFQPCPFDDSATKGPGKPVVASLLGRVMPQAAANRAHSSNLAFFHDHFPPLTRASSPSSRLGLCSRIFFSSAFGLSSSSVVHLSRGCGLPTILHVARKPGIPPPVFAFASSKLVPSTTRGLQVWLWFFCYSYNIAAVLRALDIFTRS